MTDPADKRPTLSRTTARLRRREPLSICLVGDSISEGYDASGFHGVPPYQPPFAGLVASGLVQLHDGPVRLHNLAIAGSTAADGRWMAEEIVATAPQLVVVAYGMNDAAWAEADEFAGNIAALLHEVRAARAETEFILVSPMLPTPQCGWVDADRFPQYRRVLMELAGREGAALADVTGAWSAVLGQRSAEDLMGNGLNHPNDAGHRLYARTILALLQPSS